MAKHTEPNNPSASPDPSTITIHPFSQRQSRQVKAATRTSSSLDDAITKSHDDRDPKLQNLGKLCHRLLNIQNKKPSETEICNAVSNYSSSASSLSQESATFISNRSVESLFQKSETVVKNLNTSDASYFSSMGEGSSKSPITVTECDSLLLEQEDEKRNSALRERFRPLEKEAKDTLPVDEFYDVIINHVREHRLTCIQGETGCGKTTRIPQFILEDCIRNKQNVRIAMMQPRRLACISLAKRVAFELGEEVGATVGYKISKDSSSGKDTRLTFMTPGFFLQVLVSQPTSINNYTHIILDEVHERNIYADMLSLVLKLLTHAATHQKIIIMSATLQGDIFSHYFCNLGEVPPRTVAVGAKRFNVDCFYLNDLLQPQAQEATEPENFALVQELLEKNGQTKMIWPPGTLFKNEKNCKNFRIQNAIIEEGMDSLTEYLIRNLAVGGETVLIFLPGMVEIQDFHASFIGLQVPDHAGTHIFSRQKAILNRWNYKLFVLHSLIPFEEQEQIFLKPDAGSVHIILSTDIAGSSLTIPNVRIVIDFCLKRQLVYDEKRHLSCLARTWISKASSKQRLGRTGRVFPGLCFRMVPQTFFQQFEMHDQPEMLSLPLDRLYLQMKYLGSRLKENRDPAFIRNIGGDKTLTTARLLAMSVQPPVIESVAAAAKSLFIAGALSSSSESSTITSFGHMILHFPVDFHITKLIYYSVIFGVPVDGVLLAACVASTDPFTRPCRMITTDPAAFSLALQRSFKARVFFDNSQYSEPLMTRSLLVEWLNTMEHALHRCAGLSAIKMKVELVHEKRRFCYANAVLPHRLTLLEATTRELGQRLISQMDPVVCHRSIKEVSGLLNTLRSTTANITGDNLSQSLCHDMLYLKALLAASFAPQFVIGKPSFVFSRSTNADSFMNAKDDGNVEVSHRMKVKVCSNLKVDPSRALIINNLPKELAAQTTFEKSVQIMCTGLDTTVNTANLSNKICGIVSFPPTSNNEGFESLKCDSALGLEDDFRAVPLAAHILAQYGEGRWQFAAPITSSVHVLKSVPKLDDKFIEESSMSEEPALTQILIERPGNLALVSWRLIRSHQRNETEEAIEAQCSNNIQAKCNFRNPTGFVTAFPANFSQPMKSCSKMSTHAIQVGVFVNQQASDSSAATRIEGMTMLPMNVALKLILGFTPSSYHIQFEVNLKVLRGGVISGINFGGNKNTIPLNIVENYSQVEQDVPFLYFEDIYLVNHVRMRFSEYLIEAENRFRKNQVLNSKQKDFKYGGNWKIENDFSLCVERDQRLIRDVKKLLKESTANERKVHTGFRQFMPQTDREREALKKLRKDTGKKILAPVFLEASDSTYFTPISLHEISQEAELYRRLVSKEVCVNVQLSILLSLLREGSTIFPFDKSLQKIDGFKTAARERD